MGNILDKRGQKSIPPIGRPAWQSYCPVRVATLIIWKKRSEFQLHRHAYPILGLDGSLNSTFIKENAYGRFWIESVGAGDMFSSRDFMIHPISDEDNAGGMDIPSVKPCELSKVWCKV